MSVCGLSKDVYVPEEVHGWQKEITDTIYGDVNHLLPV